MLTIDATALADVALLMKTGFWGEDDGGWFHDTLYLVCALLIVATGGGGLVLRGGLVLLP